MIMKKTLFVVFAICLLLAGLFGCVGEPPEPPYQVYAWTNESGVNVKMIAIVENNYPDKGNFTNFEKIVADGDTLHGHYYEGGFYDGTTIWDQEWYPYLPHETLFEVKAGLIFLDEAKKCLVFDGEIEDYSFDVRSRFSYEEGEQIQSDILTIEYVYTITHQHREMAREEDCQSSASE
jgi:hypothetical protein